MPSMETTPQLNDSAPLVRDKLDVESILLTSSEFRGLTMVLPPSSN